MLFAVEGGGFFSSSASGYSKGLTLLLLGHKEDKPMRVSPYHLVEQDLGPETQLQLASPKKPSSCGCASLVCFGCPSPDIDSSHLQAGVAEPQEVFPATIHDGPKRNGEDEKLLSKVMLKSSLKKRLRRVPVAVNKEVSSEETHSLSGSSSGVSAGEDERKVQWTDVCGLELAQVREFEPSETCGSEDGVKVGFERSCTCVIM